VEKNSLFIAGTTTKLFFFNNSPASSLKVKSLILVTSDKFLTVSYCFTGSLFSGVCSPFSAVCCFSGSLVVGFIGFLVNKTAMPESSIKAINPSKTKFT